VELPITMIFPSRAFSRWAVLFAAALSAIHSCGVAGSAPVHVGAATEASATVIWFFVRVPVLSVQIVVADPIVSQAIRRRTRQFARVILRIARESERATLIGSPSGTAATTITTASMK